MKACSSAGTSPATSPRLTRKGSSSQPAAPPAAASVIAIPDEDRGEKLIALYERSAIDPAELAQALAASDLPKLWLPKRAVLPVEALPVIGTGQLDPFAQPKNWPNKEPNRSWYKSNALR